LDFICKGFDFYLFVRDFVAIVLLILIIFRFIEVNHMESCQNSVLSDDEACASLGVLLSSLRIGVMAQNETNAIGWMDRCVLYDFSVIVWQAIVLVAFII
jgi:hypothetical protein